MAISRLSDASIQDGLPKFDNLWDGFSAVGAMEPISAITLAASSASIEFNNIPGTYSHLQLRGIARTATNVSLGLRFNSDTGSNYSRHFLNGSGSSAAAGGGASTTTIFAGTAAQASSTFGANVIDILDYKDTSKYTTVRSFSGSDNNGSGFVQFMSGNWRNTNAVTSISIIQVEGDQLTQYTQFALYGIK